jgi:anti-anti-sigma factor
MLIFVEAAHDVAVLRIAARDLTLYDHQSFLREIEPFLSRHSRLLLDMEDVQTIDGYGISTLLGCLNQLRQKGGDLKLMRVTAPVRDFFEIARVHRLFEFYNTLPEALAAFGANGNGHHRDAAPVWQPSPGVAD